MLGSFKQWYLSHLRGFWTFAFVLWLCIVWGHSLMTGDVSSAESDQLVPLFSIFGETDELFVTFVIRKTAHFLEYAVLAALGRRMSIAWFGLSRVSWLVTGAIWAIIPCMDETIQLSVPGRTGKISDVFLDMVGGLVGLAVFEFARRKREQKGGHAQARA